MDFKNIGLWAVLLGILSAVLTFFPMWWPLFVKDKTIPAWLAERNRSGMKTPILLWLPPLLSTVGMLLLMVLVISLGSRDSKVSDRHTLVDDNRERLLNAFQDSFGRFRNYPVATKRDLSNPVVSNRVVFIADVQRGPNMISYIEGKRFIDCAIIGPAVLGGGSDLVVVRCEFGIGGPNVDSMVIEMTSSMKAGIIGLRSCGFIDCAFFDVSFLGPKAFLESFRAGIISER